MVALTACGNTDVIATTDGSVPGADGSTTRGDAAADDSREAYCEGRGPALTLPGPAGDTCTGEVAERLFRYAVCACESFEPTGSLRTDSFDSDDDGMTVDSGGPVGTNGSFSSVSTVAIGGTLTAAGAVVDLTGSDVWIGGDLRAAGDVEMTGDGMVARDARVGGDLNGVGSFTIARDLYHPAGSRVSGVSVGGATIPGPVAIAEPCQCGDEVLDIDAVVAAAASANHNADVGLATDAYTNLVSDHTIELPCGRFYLDDIGGTGDLTIRVTGRTALYIGGDVTVTGSLGVELGPEGELDVFITGTLDGTGSFGFGDPARPAATRVYVGGTGDVSLQGDSAFVGNLYAPRAPIRITGSSEVFGSLFGRRVESSGELEVHYDRAILEVGEDCPDIPPPTCGACGDCSGGYACGEDGTCGEGCESDADCCDPFTCDPAAGVCRPVLI